MIRRQHRTNFKTPSRTHSTNQKISPRSSSSWRREVKANSIEDHNLRPQKVSTRNLAASLWRRQMQEETEDDGSYWSSGDESGFRPKIESLSFNLFSLDTESTIKIDFTNPEKSWRSTRALKIFDSSISGSDDTIAFISDLKAELRSEMIARKQMEIRHLELVHELAEAKLRATFAKNRYKTERKKRELMEELCEELDGGIEEEKGRAEAWRMKLMKLRSEVEEEREMVCVAKALREEQVKMKLIDAKVALKDKYCQLSALVAQLERFLGSGKRCIGDHAVVLEPIRHCNNVEENDIEFERFMFSSPSSILGHLGAIFSYKESNVVEERNDPS